MYHYGRFLYLLTQIVHYGSIACLLILIFLPTSCSTPAVLTAPPDAVLQIQSLKESLQKNPDNEASIRDLGILYFQTGNYRSAEILLKRAWSKNPDPVETRFYLAMAYEQNENIEDAISLLSTYLHVSGNNQYRELMEGRYHWLVNQKISKEMKARFANESTLSLSAASPAMIAVFPLTYGGTDEELSPLGRGLAEMIMVDLGHIDRLKIVERVRLQEVMTELRLSRSKEVDQSTAPRIGKLLKAGILIHGNYRDLNQDNLRIDLAAWNVTSSELPQANSKTDRLENLFKLEKSLVFQTLVELEIEPTPEERKRIENIPTRSLQAFLRYSIALELQDQQRYDEANQEFEAAFKLDPGFSAARKGAEKSRSLKKAAVPFSNLVKRFPQFRTNPSMRKLAGRTLLKRRLGHMKHHLGSGFRPGRERRKGAVEADATGDGLLSSPPPSPIPAGK